MGEAIMTSARGGTGGVNGKYKLQVRIFNANGTFVVPGNVKNNVFKVMCYGGGGSSDGYCGGGGGYMNIMELNNLPTSVSIPITIGAGGFRNIFNEQLKGNTGGTTTFGNYVSANGGTGGAWKNNIGGSGGSGGGGGGSIYGANGGTGYQFGGGGAGGMGMSRSVTSLTSTYSAWLNQYCGGNGGEYGGGGGSTKSCNFYPIQASLDGYDSSDNPKYSISYNMYNFGNSSMVGIGGNYGGNGGYNNGKNGSEFSNDFLNIQDSSLVLGKNSKYGVVGAGNYNNGKISGGGGGGGYGGIGGNGGNGFVNIYYRSGRGAAYVGAGGGGGGGGYGANGGHASAGSISGAGGGGGGGYGGRGADASGTQGGGGGGFGPSNYGAGGGGGAINGLNGKSGICIIQYYEMVME